MAYDDLGRMIGETHTRGGLTVADSVRTYGGASNLVAIQDNVSAIRIENSHTLKNELQSTSWILNAGSPGTPFRSLSYTYHAMANDLATRHTTQYVTTAVRFLRMNMRCSTRTPRRLLRRFMGQ